MRRLVVEVVVKVLGCLYGDAARLPALVKVLVRVLNGCCLRCRAVFLLQGVAGAGGGACWCAQGGVVAGVCDPSTPNAACSSKGAVYTPLGRNGLSLTWQAGASDPCLAPCLLLRIHNKLHTHVGIWVKQCLYHFTTVL